MTSEEALIKTHRINMLFDFYAPLLTDRQRTFLDLYVHDDHSLGEIAAEFEISRQAVYEHVNRAIRMLEQYEDKLRLLEKHEAKGRLVERIADLLEQSRTPHDAEIRRLVDKLYAID